MEKKQLLEKLFSLHRFGIKPGLERISLLLNEFGNPQNKYKKIHVAGTNGKGTISSCIASILQESGFKVGLYTSPHFFSFNERIKVNGQDIDDDSVCALLEKLLPYTESNYIPRWRGQGVDSSDILKDSEKDFNSINNTSELNQNSIHPLPPPAGDNKNKPLPLTPVGDINQKDLIPTFFDFTTALAFIYFTEQQVDYAVIEAGMGGRFDSTNIIVPEVSVITQIDLDHQEYLGNTIEEIALEKAGIIKQGAKCIVAEQKHNIKDIFRKAAEEKECELIFVDEHYFAKGIKFNPDLTTKFTAITPKGEYKISSPLAGKHQIRNVLTAIAAVESLKYFGK